MRTQGLSKGYTIGGKRLEILRDVDLEIKRGEMIAVVGQSGAGKSTLLHMLGALDRPDAGKVYFEKFDIFKLSEVDLARLRNRKIGFVFQFHHLLPEFTALENAMMPLLAGGARRRSVTDRAVEVLRRVGLGERLDHRPGELSGGEQQRVALARALINRPLLLLADEPTGNLDSHTGESILETLKEIHAQDLLTSVIVTHNERLAADCDRVLHLEDGRLKDYTLPK
ncbi:MAG TPA: ABC transporter ATP-binding protein [Blastocatellia bacterium]|nr:ABC transporter ATP-binding protein [Blastocatellia bacterium]